MKHIQTDIEIDAPPDIVWEVLTELSSYREWNPHITAASGNLREGAAVEIEVQSNVESSNSRSQTMTPTVTSMEPLQTLQWNGTILFSWVFRGQHTFHLDPLGDDRTQLVNEEQRSGILAPFVTDDDTWRDYEAMNQALKERAERRALDSRDRSKA